MSAPRLLRSATLLRPSGAIALFAAVAASLVGCGSADRGGGPAEPGGVVDEWSNLPPMTNPDPELAPLGMRELAYQRTCARGRADGFAQALCNHGARPQIRDMVELLDLVGLGVPEQRAFALTGNSTSLVAMSVSAINPRLLVFPRVEDDRVPPDTMTAVGFVRGEQFVEIVSRDVTTGDLNFYLVAFEQACSYASGGCDLASLFTEELESNWTAYSVYDHEDLEPTSFDCLSCHRPGGQGSGRMLRMQELASPWMHWFPQRFAQRTESDRVLLTQFTEAHADDAQYGGIPVSVITNALDEGSGAQLEALLRAEGFGDQPNPFDAQIAAEMKTGSSPIWQSRFEVHLRGEAIAVPYPRIDVTDETKRSAATRAYRDVVAGVAPRETLLDLRLVFSDDAAEKLSFVPNPAADGRTVLLQMCGRCHDGRGDPALSKNAFDVRKLEEMPRAMRDLAIMRMSEPLETRMPPWRVGILTQEAIQAATLELER